MACLNTSYAVDECGGSLAGMCADYFGFAPRNCSDMPTQYFGKPCPVMSAVFFCQSCVTSQFYYPLYKSTMSGVREANPHNEIVMFEITPYDATNNFSAFHLDLSAIVESLVNCRVMFAFSGFWFYTQLTAAYPDVYFIVVLNAALSSADTQDRFLYVVGRSELAVWVGGMTLAAQTPNTSFLFSSSVLDGIRQVFFMGMASAAVSSGNATTIFAPTVADAVASYSLLSSLTGNTPNVMGVTAQDVYRFTNRSFTLGVVSDFLGDPTTFRNMNSTESEHVLGSVLIDLSWTYLAAASGAARGQFTSGVVTVDPSTMILVPCKFSCHLMKPAATKSFSGAFRDILDPRMDLGVQYSFFERSLPASTSQFVPLSPLSGADVLLMQPQLLQMADLRTAFVLNLMNRAGCCGFISLAVGHLQLQQQACPDRLAGRLHYASALDSSTNKAYVVGGIWSSSSPAHTFSLMNDVWSTELTIFAANLSWTNHAAPSNAPGPRFGHACVVVSGVLYMFGGRVEAGGILSGPIPDDPLEILTGDLDSGMYALNLTDYSWNTLSPCPDGGRAFHSSLVLPEGGAGGPLIIFFGGSAPSTSSKGSVAFDPAVGNWVALPQTLTSPLVQSALQGVVRPCMGAVSNTTIIAATKSTCFAISNGIDAAVEVLPECKLPQKGVASCIPGANAQLLASGRWAVLAAADGHIRRGAVLILNPSFPTCEPSINQYPTPSLLSCQQCPRGTFSDGNQCVSCTRDDGDDDQDDPISEFCSQSSSSTSKLIVAVSVAAFCAVAAAVVVRMIHARRRLRLILSSDYVADQLADCIEKLDFSQLDYYSTTLKSPSRLQQAFLDIKNVLSRLVSFMPMWVYDMDRTENDEDVARSIAAATAVNEWDLSDQGSQRSTTIAMSAASRSTFNNRFEQLAQRPPVIKDDFGECRMYRCKVTIMTILAKASRYDIAQYNTAIETIMILARRSRGIFEHQLGNTVYLSFNGLRCNDNGYEAALKTFCNLNKALNDVCPDMHWCCGIATQWAVAGLIGWRYGRHSSLLGSSVVRRASRLASAANVIDSKNSACCVSAADAADRTELHRTYAFRLEGVTILNHIGNEIEGSETRELIASFLGPRQQVPRAVVLSMEARNRILQKISHCRINEAIAAFQRDSPHMLDSDKEVARMAMSTGSLHVVL